MKYRILIVLITALVTFSTPSYGQWNTLFRKAYKLFKPAAKKSHKMARSTYKISKSTLHTIPLNPSPTTYTSIIPDNPNAFLYSTDLNHYLRKNSLIDEKAHHTDFFKHLESRDNSTSSVIIAFHRDRISSAQRYLKSKGFLDHEVSGVWDEKTQKALIRYHTSFSNELKSYPNSISKTKALKEFNSAIPKELLSKTFNKNKVYKQFIEERLFEKITVAQSNLNKLGYYNGKVDGLYGPDSHKARKAFEKDFDLSKIKYDFVYAKSDRIAHIEIKEGDDFIKYWSKQREDIETMCNPSLCISKDNLAISLDCNGQTLGISTQGEVTVSASNGTDTFEQTFNKQQNSSSICEIDWKICLSKTTKMDVSICNVAVTTSSAGHFKISSKNGNKTRSVSLF